MKKISVSEFNYKGAVDKKVPIQIDKFTTRSCGLNGAWGLGFPSNLYWLLYTDHKSLNQGNISLKVYRVTLCLSSRSMVTTIVATRLSCFKQGPVLWANNNLDEDQVTHLFLSQLQSLSHLTFQKVLLSTLNYSDVIPGTRFSQK